MHPLIFLNVIKKAVNTLEAISVPLAIVKRRLKVVDSILNPFFVDIVDILRIAVRGK